LPQDDLISSKPGQQAVDPPTEALGCAHFVPARHRFGMAVQLINRKKLVTERLLIRREALGVIAALLAPPPYELLYSWRDSRKIDPQFGFTSSPSADADETLPAPGGVQPGNAADSRPREMPMLLLY
jgi:hypothetical protein